MLAIITSHPIQYQAPLWREFARSGMKFEVWFLTPHAVNASYDREFGRTFAWDLNLLDGYPHRFLPIAEGWRLDWFRGIRLQTRWADEFRARGVTHVWVEGWRFSVFWSAVHAAQNAGLRVLLRGETPDLTPEPAWRRLWKRPLLRWFFRRVDHFLCIGSANRRFYLRYGIPSARLAAAPYCIDNARFAAAAAELRPRRAELRARWGIAPDAYVVLFCGKLIAKKRPLDLVRAARLQPVLAGRPVHLLFAGDGELAGVLREALAEPESPLGTITGFLNQSEIPAVFAAADCLVLPSDYGETWGLVVNEALASGLPAIVSDHCGCAEDLGAPLGPAHVFPCGDTHALARSMAEVARWPPAAGLLRDVADAHAPRRTVEGLKHLLQ
jgi:glycosyltransferase involved in cell wall biosynthesis